MSKLEKIADEMMNELYTNSTPRITWKQFIKKYRNTGIQGHKKHKISKEKCEAILEKYTKKLPTRYRNSLAMLWLDLAPSYKGSRTITLDLGKEKKCNTCEGFGLWGMGDPCPIGPMDASDGMPTIACPECGANKNPIKKKKK
jgi:hypothetical protein